MSLTCRRPSSTWTLRISTTAPRSSVDPPKFVSSRFAGGKAGTTDCVLDAIRKSSLPARILPPCLHGRNPKNRPTWGILDHCGSLVGFSGSRLVRETVGARGRSDHRQPQCTRVWGATPLPASVSAIRTDGKRTAHGVRVIYRATHAASAAPGMMKMGSSFGSHIDGGGCRVGDRLLSGASSPL